MKSLESRLFNKDFHFKVTFINTCIMRIRYGHRKERTIQGYKMYIFKMMKDIVKKNVCNYENLMRATDCVKLPTHDEIIADCWTMFDKCLTKFKITKKNNFYYYFNKSLSRNFYREYQKELKNARVELTDAMTVVHPLLHDNNEPDTMEALMDSLGFDEIDRRIVKSRLNGQKTSEFLKENEDISNGQYSKSLKKMKDVIRFYQSKGIF